jgi:hypothetical protein
MLFGRGFTNAPAASFTDPTDLGSKLVIWLDFSDASNMNTLADGTGSVPGDGVGVRLVNDKSGNGNHMSNSADFGVYNSAGSYVNLNAGIVKPQKTSALTGLTSDMIVFCVMNNNGDTSWTLAGEFNDSGAYLGLAQNGSSSATDASFGSGITYYDDGVVIGSPTRDTLHDEWQGKWSYPEAHGVDMTITGISANLRPFFYPSAGLDLNGYARHWILTTNDLTAGEISSLRTWLAAEAAS